MKSDKAKQKRAMRLLAASESRRRVQDVAEKMGVHRATIWRWYNAPGMKEYYREWLDIEADKSAKNLRESGFYEAHRDDKPMTLDEALRIWENPLLDYTLWANCAHLPRPLPPKRKGTRKKKNRRP